MKIWTSRKLEEIFPAKAERISGNGMQGYFCESAESVKEN
jgi:hypothetical protein